MNINPLMEKNVYNVYSYDIGKEYLNFIDNLDIDPILEQIFYIKIMEEHCISKKYKFLYTPINFQQNIFFEKFHNITHMMKFNQSIFPNLKENSNMKSLVCDHPNEIGYEYISTRLYNWIKENEPELISETTPNFFESKWDGYPILKNLNKVKLPI
jgi:hypothetical protein